MKAFGHSSISETGITAADGDKELTGTDLPGMSCHQLSLYPAVGASGTVPVSIRPKGAPDTYSEALMASDGVTPVVIDLSDPTTVCFPATAVFAAIDALILDCSGVTGTFDAVLESR